MHAEGDNITLETKRMIIEIEKGIITRIFNRLTGTEYVSTSTKTVPQDFHTGLVYVFPQIAQREEKIGVVGATPSPAKGAKVLLPTLMSLKEFDMTEMRKVGDRGVEYHFQSKDESASLKIEYSIDKKSSDILVSLEGEGKRKGLSAVRFALPPITCRGNLLLPVFNGIKACRGKSPFKFEGTTWGWPTGWQASFIIFDDPLGGLWIYTHDAKRRFKEVRYNYEGNGTWSVAFDTVNYAPFNLHDSIESVVWRLDVYEGDWTIPVRQYKRWIYDTYKIKEKEKFRPSWVDEIKLVIKHADYMSDEQIVPFLELLEKYVDPQRTLLFMTNWMVSEPVIIPNWVASEHGARFNREARKRGFRTMYYANYIGITPNHPKFDEFRDHFIRNPYTNEFEGWNLKGEWSEATDIKLYYVNPAYKPWRDYQISQFKALFDKNPADGLFLDQSFLMFNDGNGLIDGQSTVEGNLAFHRELAEALPGVALGGESINEITMQYESICELHFLSLEMKRDSDGNLNWEINPAAFDRMVPIVSELVLPHTHPIGYLGFPDTRSSFYAGWRDALHIYRGILTLTRPTVDEIKDPESEVRRVLRRAFPEK